MKIAIKGHQTRGKEIIQILKNLGATSYRIYNKYSHPEWYWYINKNKEIVCNPKESILGYKLYTLEEFEKEYSFKTGDLCTYYSDILNKEIVVKILRITVKNDYIVYEIDYEGSTRAHSGIYREKSSLKPYKKMQERNITLTLGKAREWYQKGGELREVALQAFTEKELTKVELPKNWEEFCKRYPIKDKEAHIDSISNIIIQNGDTTYRMSIRDRNICPSKKSAVAHLALIQLEQLRDCYRGLFITVIGMPVWCIKRWKGKLIIEQRVWGTNENFLSFQSYEVAEEYLKNFGHLIKQAGDLI